MKSRFAPLFASIVLIPLLSVGFLNDDFIGLTNYQQLLFGIERSHFLGVLKSPTPVGWARIAWFVPLPACFVPNTWRKA